MTEEEMERQIHVDELERRQKQWQDLGQVCLTCRAWSEVFGSGGSIGRCVKHAPVVISVGSDEDFSGSTEWPCTRCYDGCREHELASCPKEGQIPKVLPEHRSAPR